eukprot:m.320176 g.320176  ORF g.320176 m.320176 type:complete len:176 (-) comp20317_c0_seq6:56-583(-)
MEAVLHTRTPPEPSTSSSPPPPVVCGHLHPYRRPQPKRHCQCNRRRQSAVRSDWQDETGRAIWYSCRIVVVAGTGAGRAVRICEHMISKMCPCQSPTESPKPDASGEPLQHYAYRPMLLVARFMASGRRHLDMCVSRACEYHCIRHLPRAVIELLRALVDQARDYLLAVATNDTC